MRKAPEQAEISNSPFAAIRKRITIAAIGLMGAAAVPACCFDWSLNPNPIDKARRDGVDGCENAKHIVIPEAEATIMLGRRKHADDKVEALLYLEPTSPLRTVQDYPQIFELPEEAAPWKTLVMEPSGRITLRLDGNYIAMVFDCSDGGETCDGDEMRDPSVLAEMQPAIVDAGVTDASVGDAGDAGVGDAGDAGVGDAGDAGDASDGAPEEPPMPDKIFKEDGKCNQYEVDEATECQIEALQPKLDSLPLNYLYILARALSKGTEYSREVEDTIDDIEQTPGDDKAKEAKKPNIICAINFLLANKKELIPKVAGKLKVDLDSCSTTSGSGGTGGNTAPTTTGRVTVDRAQFLKRVNALRTQYGRSPVAWGQCAQAAAKLWAENEDAQTIVNHRIGSNDPAARRSQLGCHGTGMENVAGIEPATADHAYEVWENSPDHRDGMLMSQIKTIGLYCVNSPKVGTRDKARDPNKTPAKNFCVMTGTADDK